MEEPRIYFITKVVFHRVPVFALDEKYPLLAIDNFKFYRKKFGFALYGFVIMPDHYHLVVNTCGKVTIKKLKEDMNKYIARQIIDDMKQCHPEVLQRLRVVVREREGHKRHEYALFQKGRYDFEIVTWDRLRQKLEYLHANPLRASLASQMEDYPYSSARNYILGDNRLIVLDPLPV